MQTINEWLRAAEKQISEFSPIAAEQRAVRIQMEQLKVQYSERFCIICESVLLPLISMLCIAVNKYPLFTFSSNLISLTCFRFPISRLTIFPSKEPCVALGS